MDIKEVEILALSLIDKHLGDSTHTWKFKFSKAKKVFGVCRYSESKNFYQIQLSKPMCLLNDKDAITDTILHEIAHALDVDIRGMSNHDSEWKKIAKSIGCKGERCYDDTIKVAPAKYTADCSTCGTVHKRHRKTNSETSCGKCCEEYNNGKFSEEYILNYKQNF